MHIRRKGKRRGKKKRKKENSFLLISLPTLKSLMATNLQGCLTIKIEKGDIAIPVSSCEMLYIYFFSSSSNIASRNERNIDNSIDVD